MRPHTLSRPSRTLTLLFVVCALAAAVAGGIARSHAATPAAHSAAAVHSKLIVGLADGAGGFGGASTANRLNEIQRTTGTHWVRDPFYWSTIEPRPGRFSWSYYDHYMLQLGRHHMHVIAQLLNAPGWAAPNPLAVPANPSAYAAYVAAVLHRYGVHGTFWRTHPRLRSSALTAVDLWNEPYFSSGNGGRYDPARYAHLIRAAGIAGHRADRSARILIEADMVPHHYNVWRWWVDSLYRAVPSLNRYFDGVAMHDFGPDVTHLTPIRAGEPYQNFDRTRRIEDVRRQFVRHHAASKPFWIMEMGWSTCHVKSIDCVTEAQQAANLRTMFGYITGRYRSWVQAVFVYRYADAGSAIGVQDAYGLIRTDGSGKPALSVFKPLAAASG